MRLRVILRLACAAVALAALAAVTGFARGPAGDFAAGAPGQPPSVMSGTPLARYWVPDAVVDEISRAAASLRLRCMYQLGFTQLPASWATALPTAWRSILPPLSRQEAASYGYHGGAQGAEEAVAAGPVRLVDRQATAAETQALNGYRRWIDGRRVPAGGCWQQADRELQAGTRSLTADPRQLAFESELRALADPRVAAVFARWSSCMRRRGFAYRTPVDATRDPRWTRAGAAGSRQPRSVTSTEIATATADASCRQQAGLDATWQGVQDSYQRRMMAGELAGLSRARSIAGSWLANARRLGADTSPAAARAIETPAAAWNGPYTYANDDTPYPWEYFSNSCYCSYNGDPVKTYSTAYSGSSYWWVSNPLTNGYRIMASAEGTPTIWAVADHDLSTKPNSGIYLWSVGSSVLANEQVYIGAASGYPAGYYYIRNRFSGLYASGYGNGSGALWIRWGGCAESNPPTYGCEVWR